MNRESLIILINKNKSFFTKKEIEISNYIIKNIEIKENINIKYIVSNCDVGFSTIYNFIKKLGLSSFKEITYLVQQENIERLIFKETLNAKTSANALITENYISNINKNSLMLDDEKINIVIDLILSSKNIYFMASGESNIATQEFCYRLNRIGIPCQNVKSEQGEMILKASSMSKKDLLISFSLSGRTKSILNAMEIAKESGAKIILITESINSEMKDFADQTINLFFNNNGDDYALISRLLSVTYLCDVIISNIIAEDIDKYMNFKLKTAGLISKFTK